MHYTETVYRITDGDLMCRILDNVSVRTAEDTTEEGVLTVGTDGIKIVYTRDFFDSHFYLFDAGETPASTIIQKDENGND